MTAFINTLGWLTFYLLLAGACIAPVAVIAEKMERKPRRGIAQ